MERTVESSLMRVEQYLALFCIPHLQALRLGSFGIPRTYERRLALFRERRVRCAFGFVSRARPTEGEDCDCHPFALLAVMGRRHLALF